MIIQQIKWFFVTVCSHIVSLSAIHIHVCYFLKPILRLITFKTKKQIKLLGLGEHLSFQNMIFRQSNIICINITTIWRFNNQSFDYL